MRTILVAVVALALVGCSSSADVAETKHDAAASPDLAQPAPDLAPPATPDTRDAEPADPLIGTWVSQMPDGSSLSMKFDGKNYASALAQRLSDGSVGVQAAKGTYVIQDKTVIAILAQATCQGIGNVAKTASMTFSRQGSGLSLLSGTTMIMFELSTSDGTGTGIVQMGCFLSDGTFKPNPLTAIP